MNRYKNIIIFGGTGSLGEEFLSYFLKKKFNIIFTSSNVEKINLIKKKYKKYFYSKKIQSFKCNFLKENDIEKVIKYSIKYFRNLDLIINSNGVFQYDLLNKLNLKNLNKVFTINALSLIIINKFILKYYKKRKFLKIISIGSSSAKSGFKDTITYCGSKHALLGIIKSLNQTLFKKKIINYCINVGGLNNKMGRSLRNKNFKNLLGQQEILKTLNYIIETRTHGIPEEINIKKLS